MTKIIEFSGTPDAGKTTLLGSLNKHLSDSGFKVTLLGEANGQTLLPHNLRGTLGFNEWVGENACNGILEALNKKPDILLVDRGFLDFRFWNYFYKHTGKATDSEVFELEHKPLFQNTSLVPDLFIAVTVSLDEAIKRHPSLAKKQDWVSTHNLLFEHFYASYRGPKEKIDTSNLSKEDVLNDTIKIISNYFPKPNLDVDER